MTKKEKLKIEVLVKIVESDMEIAKTILNHYHAKGIADKYYFGLECGEKKKIEIMEKYINKLKELAK